MIKIKLSHGKITFKSLIIIILTTTVDLSDVKTIKINPNLQQIKNIQLQSSSSNQQVQSALIPIEHVHLYNENVPPLQEKDVVSVLQADPLLATLILSYNLHLTPKPIGFNHPQHLPVNPYVSLLLSHYGRYVPAHGYNRGIYGYAAANNYLNNLPFGSYKLYEDVDV
ncbi:uncharacterized protein [Onthophagus taurus]|uniref:uncharacterized protein n=1 Tax=Onthophagus taurus TaxID=166361 RepID=UPI0039BE32BC